MTPGGFEHLTYNGDYIILPFSQLPFIILKYINRNIFIHFGLTY